MAAYDYNGAIKSGANPTDVGNYLAKQTGYNFQGAVTAGANINATLGYMSGLPFKSATPPSSPIVEGAIGDAANNMNTDLTSSSNDLAHSITDTPQRVADITKETGSPGLGLAGGVAESGVRAAGAVAGGIGKFGNDLLKAVPGVAPLLDHISKNLSDQSKADPNSWGNKIISFLGDQATKHPELAKDTGAITNILTALLGEKGISEMPANPLQSAKDALGNVKSAISSPTVDDATNEGVANIANQEGGIVAPTKTASQLAEESQQKTWDVIKPKLSSNATKAAADNGALVRTGEKGVLTQVPTAKDIADIKLARPYVESAGGDPIKTRVNIKTGIANEAANLREAVGTRGGTFSTSNIKGVMDKVPVPAAIKGGAEMNQVNNIKEFVSTIAAKVDKNPQGALDLAQKFRQNINSEFGENVWGKNTPIGNYIKNANKALNDFISTRLPDGKLPDGTLIKDSFAKQTQLYKILDNIQVPKIGDQLVTPTEEAPLKVPGSPLSEAAKAYGKEHPITKNVAKAVAKGSILGSAVHLIP